jgi:hypothetical protein
MTLYEIGYDILKMARGSNISRSETISLRQVFFWINGYRAKLIKQQIDKGNIDDAWIQEMSCLELSVRDRGECPSTMTLTSGCAVLRTVLEIPQTIKGKNMDGLLFVGSIDGKPYQIITPQRYSFITSKPYSGRDTYAYRKGNYIYIMNNLPLKYVSLHGIFSDPTQLSTYINNCSSTVCYNVRTEDYPVNMEMLDTIRMMIMEREMKMTIALPSDKDNDSQNIVTPNSNVVQ